MFGRQKLILGEYIIVAPIFCQKTALMKERQKAFEFGNSVLVPFLRSCKVWTSAICTGCLLRSINVKKLTSVNLVLRTTNMTPVKPQI
jgi:hypothetical protein